MTSFIYLKVEQKRGDCASGVECYMKQYDVSEKKAIEEIQKMAVNVWKDINEDCMRPPCCYSFLDPMFAGRLTKANERNIFFENSV
jgi:hypothetical protein